MLALTAATVIVEAGEQSGSLIQGRAAIEQGRKVFILESCFNRGLNWPEKFLESGAIRVRNYGDFKAPSTNQALPACRTAGPASDGVMTHRRKTGRMRSITVGDNSRAAMVENDGVLST